MIVMETKELGIIGTILIVVLGGTIFYLEPTTEKNVCTLSGQSSPWEPTELPNLYYCKPENVYKWCSRLSATKVTCYLYKEMQINRAKSSITQQLFPSLIINENSVTYGRGVFRFNNILSQPVHKNQIMHYFAFGEENVIKCDIKKEAISYRNVTKYSYQSVENCSDVSFLNNQTNLWEKKKVCETNQIVTKQWNETEKITSFVDFEYLNPGYHTLQLYCNLKPMFGEDKKTEWVTSFGYEAITFDQKQWAWWDESWPMRKNVTFTEKSGFALNDGYIEYWFNHEGNAQADCDDIRVINDIGNELQHNFTSCNATHVYLGHNVNLTASGTVEYSVYYGNADVGSTAVSLRTAYAGGDSDLFKEELNNYNAYWSLVCVPSSNYRAGVNTTSLMDGTYSQYIDSGTDSGGECAEYPGWKYGPTFEHNSTNGGWSGLRAPIRIEFYYRGDVDIGGCVRFINKSATTPTNITFAIFHTRYWGRNGATGSLDLSLTANSWYNITLDDIRWSQYTLDLYVNGTSKLSDGAWFQNISSINGISIYQGNQDANRRYQYIDYGRAWWNVTSSLGSEESSVDTTPPQWSNMQENNPDPSTYSYSPNYGFQVTCTDNIAIENAFFEHNLTGSWANITCSNVNSVYYVNITSMGASVLNYSFVCRDLIGNENRSDYATFTVTKATPSLTLTLDGSSSTPQTRTYPNATDVLSSETNDGDDNCNYVLARNGTSFSNGAITFGAASHNITYNTTGCANYTSNHVERILAVNPRPLIIYQWGQYYNYTNTNISVNISIWVYNNESVTLTNIDVTPDSDFGSAYTIAILSSGISNITVLTNVTERGTSDAYLDIDVSSLSNNYTGISNSLRLMNPIDPPSKALILKKQNILIIIAKTILGGIELIRSGW